MRDGERAQQKARRGFRPGLPAALSDCAFLYESRNDGHQPKVETEIPPTARLSLCGAASGRLRGGKHVDWSKALVADFLPK